MKITNNIRNFPEEKTTNYQVAINSLIKNSSKEHLRIIIKRCVNNQCISLEDGIFFMRLVTKHPFQWCRK
jgi:hypothetical protein